MVKVGGVLVIYGLVSGLWLLMTKERPGEAEMSEYNRRWMHDQRVGSMISLIAIPIGLILLLVGLVLG